MLTSFAQPRERDAAPEHLRVRHALGEGTQLRLRLTGQRHVDDPAALHTVQMRVGVGAGVEPLLPAEHADAHRVALFGEEAQVPVHRAEAQVGIVRLELLVELLRGGVGGRRCEGFEDDLPLFAVFACGHRSTSLHISNKNYY